MSETAGIDDFAANGMEIGLYTFGELVPDIHTGQPAGAQQRMQEVLAAARLADTAGLDVFAVGEHHRLELAISTPPVVLGAIAQITERIRLASAVTVLSTSDPVRVFEDFATVDLLSNGRAEIIAGRGSTIETFPLFGYDLNDYDSLFEEKIDLLLKLNASGRVTWEGRFRPALKNADIAPRPAQDRLPIWIGVGGTPQSAARAGHLGTGLAVAIIGGAWPHFKPLVDLYRRSGSQAGHGPPDLRVAITSPLYI